MTSVALRPDDDGEQRGMEKAVLHLLHRVDKPFELAKSPAIQAVCSVTGIARAASALRHIVDEALPPEDAQSARLRDVINPFFAGDERVIEVAARLGISVRQLQRKRAQAVTAIACYMRTLLDGQRGIGDLQNPTGDAAATLMRIASSVEPRAAETIHRLTGKAEPEQLQLVHLRSTIDRNVELTKDAFASFPSIPRSVVAQFIMLSRELHGQTAPAQDIAGIMTGPYSPSVRFELEYLAFLRARARGFASEMYAIANNMRRLAGDRSASTTIALCSLADAALRNGHVNESSDLVEQAARLALARSDLRGFATTTLLRARIAMQVNDIRRAEELAGAAYAALVDSYRCAYDCAVLVSQARWLRGERWRPGSELSRLPQSAWDSAAINIEIARHLTVEAQYEKAEALALESHRRASSLEFTGLAARAAGVLYGVRTAQGNTAAAFYWRADAVERLLTTRDRQLALNLLITPMEPVPFSCDSLFLEALYRSLCVYVPQMLSDAPPQVAAVKEMLVECVTYLAEPTRHLDCVRSSADEIRKVDSALSHYASQGTSGIQDVLTLLALAIGANETIRNGRVIGELCECLFNAVRAPIPRAFTIVTPQPGETSSFGAARVDVGITVNSEDAVGGLRVEEADGALQMQQSLAVGKRSTSTRPNPKVLVRTVDVRGRIPDVSTAPKPQASPRS